MPLKNLFPAITVPHMPMEVLNPFIVSKRAFKDPNETASL